uniref:YfiR family protein n=1 Tax=candidate division WOR-3 bacterium TaxID=2052148 RepID=A0A7C4YGR9_UNCW3
MKKSIFIIIVILFFLSSKILADEVPIEVQIPLYFKIFSFDRNLKQRCPDTIKIGILYDPKKNESVKNKDEFIKVFNSLKDKTISGIPVQLTPISYGDSELIKQVDIAYLSLSLSNKELTELLNLLNNWNIPSLGLGGKSAELGVVVSLSVFEGKPQIVINLPAAKRLGIDFSSRLLSLAKVINE